LLIEIEKVPIICLEDIICLKRGTEMPVTMGGIASGIQTDDIIDKLLNVESAPIKKLQIEKQEYLEKQEALKQMGSILKELHASAKDLYGFRASYDDKKAISSNPSILEAIALKQADKGTKHIVVERLAGFHKIISDNIEKNEKLPAADFTIEVNGIKENIRFRGGTIENLRDRIDESMNKYMTSMVMNTTGSKYVLSLESKTSGEKGEILISGAKDLFKKIGLVSGQRDADSEKTVIAFDNKNFYQYGGKLADKEDGTLNISPDGKSAEMKGLLWREFALPVEKELKKDTALNFNFEYKAPDTPEKEDETLPYKIEFGPTEKIVIKGIELNSYNISREREIEKKPQKKDFKDDVSGVGIVWDENGERKEKLFTVQKDSKGLQEIPIGSELEGKKISKIIFYCNDGSSIFSNTVIVTPLKGKDLLEPKNVISKAENSKMKIDGVSVERDRNEGIVDLIKGITLNLKSARPDETVILNIDNDIDKSIEKIKKFVDNYNRYVDMNSALTKTATITKAGEYNKMKREAGIFSSDMTFVSLLNQLKTALSNAYLSKVEKPIRVLPETGVHTGEIKSSWESIKQGKLQINEPKLREVIISNPEGIRNFFGTDNDGDNRTDGGLAFAIERVLDPYVTPVEKQNIIQTKIAYEKESAKGADERIERLQMHLKAYEEKLRKKFATMEKSVSGAKSQRDWMNQQSGSSDK